VTTDQLIDGILRREGGFVDNPNDRGAATNFGITARTLGEWRRLGRPATREEVGRMTVDEARAIYAKRYVEPFVTVVFDDLRAQLVDIAVNMGSFRAIQLLQTVLGVPVDGILGDRTRAALAVMPWKLTVNALVAARVQYYVELVDTDDSQRVFFLGWIRRAVEFVAL
jgi:lysozyme family protein